MDSTSSVEYSGTLTDTAATAGFMAFLGAYMIFIIIILAIVVVSLWKIFEKAGKPGWAALVPIYNFYILLEIVGRPTWWLAAILLGLIPIVGPIAAIVVSVILGIDLAKSFGKDTGFGVLLALLPVVGYPMLAFGKDVKYVGPAAATTNKPSTPA